MDARNGTAVGSRRAAVDRESTVLTQLHDLAPHLDGEPDPAFRAATRARLVAMAAVRSPEPEPASPLRRLLAGRGNEAAPAAWRARVTAGLAGAALTVTALSTLVALSTDARPGDVLYQLKRGTEETQLALAGDAHRGRTLLDQAGTRLGELQYLVSEDATALPAAPAEPAAGTVAVVAGGADPQLVLETLDTMDEQTSEGAAWMAQRAVTTGDPAPLEELSGWAAGQAAGLAALGPDVPDVARDAVSDSLDLLAGITTRTADLRTALDCAAGPATSGADGLGPVPAACSPGAGTDGSVPATTAGPTDRSGATTAPAPSTDGGPGQVTAGSSIGGSLGGPPGSGSSGSTSRAEVPGGVVPTPSLPVPLPLPSVTVAPPRVPAIPSVPLPRATAAVPTPPVDLDVDVCLGPVNLGSC